MMLRAFLCVLMGLIALSPRNVMAIDEKTTAERLRDIKLLSPIDRDRLDRNIQDFQQLNSSQKAHYRTMHAELIVDRKQAGDLTALMQSYSAWLNSLTPAQQDEVRSESDPAKKLTIVRRIKEESEHPKSSHELHNDPLPMQPFSRFPPHLESKDVAAVMKAIATQLPANRLKSEIEQPDFESYIPLINSSIQTSSSPKEWPDELLFKKIVESVHSSEKKTAILRATSRRDAMIRFLLIGIFKQLVDSIRMPSDKELLETFAGLNDDEKQNVKSQSGDVMKRLLTRRYFESKGDDSFNKPPVYRRRLAELCERLEVPVPLIFAQRKPRPAQGRGP